MSGIAGIVRFDGGEIDARRVDALTRALAVRGPDRQDAWIDRGVALTHTLLRTDDLEPRLQPATLDGSVWITADARVDDHDALVRRLESCGRTGVCKTDDALLILHAYHAWGIDCVRELLGDFSFAIWDGRAHRLFCARDHFGIKPFYFAETPAGFVFGNTLKALRTHSGVSGTLNELAVADFLLFGINQDTATTIFADIKRLPPAHLLTVDQAGGVQIRRYWSVPSDGCIRYRRSADYTDRFLELLQSAVADRVRSRRVSVWMSGGVDSTSITAVTRQVLSARGATFDLRTHTIVYDTLIPDHERHYAQLAASALGVDHKFFVADAYRPLEGWSEAADSGPEPTGDPFILMRERQLAEVAAHSRTLLCGEGGDEVFWPTLTMDVVGRMPAWELAADFAYSLFAHRRRPAVGLRRALRRVFRGKTDCPPYPEWMSPAFAARLALRERWQRVHRDEMHSGHARRPEAHRRLASAPWSWYFESSDPGATRVPVEVRYPFLDLRLVNYLLAIPPMPWCVDKYLLRLAMREALPNPVRLRRKAALGGDPLAVHLRRSAPSWVRQARSQQLDAYVNDTALPISTEGYRGQDPWLDVRPFCLGYWLQHAGIQTA
jgi:asparagine synthase (glutamine-hydrolysing)